MRSRGALTLGLSNYLPPIRALIRDCIDMSEVWLFYYDKTGRIPGFPIGIRSEGWRTPLGALTKVERKYLSVQLLKQISYSAIQCL
jgi:hypothetical protein